MMREGDPLNIWHTLDETMEYVIKLFRVCASPIPHGKFRHTIGPCPLARILRQDNPWRH